MHIPKLNQHLSHIREKLIDSEYCKIEQWENIAAESNLYLRKETTDPKLNLICIWRQRFEEQVDISMMGKPGKNVPGRRTSSETERPYLM